MVLKSLIPTFIILLCVFKGSDCIKCYQCSTAMDPEGEDYCGAYSKFDKQKNIAIECNSDESKTPGTFCVKITKQGPRGFVWDGRWRQVIRKCASISTTGVTNVCNWGVDDNGDYWQECSCSEDACNTGTTKNYLFILIILPFLLTLKKFFY